MPTGKVLKEAFNPSRNQYLAVRILESLQEEVSEKGKILAVLDLDLYASGLSFVFGQAKKDCAILSIFRLKTNDPKLFYQRVLKEASHELGHAFGLSHC